MLKSMTGQGNATADNDVHSATVEIRSVNHRHFKLSLRMPEILNPMEPAIDRFFRTQIHRGSINVNIRIDSLATEAGYVIDRELIASYLQDFRQAMNDPNLMLKPDTLIGLPGVLSSHEKDLNLDEPMQSLILEVVSNATEQLHHMKSTEGEQLATDLRRNMNTVMDNLKTVRIRAPEVLEQFAKKIADRVNRRLEEHQLTLDDRDLIREVAIFADRCDISEEIVRLDSHLMQMGELIDSDENTGRKLDFLAQELLRETNTIGSKANDAHIAKNVVEMKSAIDRIKEQVQNIE